MAEKLDILLKECKRGKSGSQEELYRRFAAAMYGLCLQYASNEEDAQDIMQEGFIKVFAKLDQVKNPAALPGWIRRVMINTALEKFRKQNQLYALGNDFESSEDVQQENVISDLSAQDLIKLIRELTPKYRMVFNLYAIEGYSHKEIGEMLGISEGTSKSNLARARYTLQKKVKKHFYIKSSIKDAK